MEQWKESQLKQFSSTTEIDTAYRSAVGFANNIGFNYFGVFNHLFNQRQSVEDRSIQ